MRTTAPWLAYPPGVEPTLAEFDWDSLRLRDDDHAEIEARAEQSLRKLNARLRARNLRRHLAPFLGALLVPVAAFLLVRLLRASYAA